MAVMSILVLILCHAIKIYGKILDAMNMENNSLQI